MFALAASDLFFHWQPNVEASLMRVHHPLPNVDLDVSPTARFGGYAPALSPNGIVVGDDASNRFLALLTGQARQQWHLDVSHSLGIPAVDENTIYSGTGGVGATAGIVSVNSANGNVNWLYPSANLPPDEQQVTVVLLPKAVVLPTYGTKPITGPKGQRLDAQFVNGYEKKMIAVPVPSPYSDQPFQQWSNSGLVVAEDRIYGEVNHAIVALNKKNGSMAWKFPLGKNGIARSIVATPEHLVICVSQTVSGKRDPVWVIGNKNDTHKLIALRLDDGKQEWSESVHRAGTLALAQGMLFFMDGDLHVMGAANPTPANDGETAAAEIPAVAHIQTAARK